jgi:superfamily II DNA or RNA helicase
MYKFYRKAGIFIPKKYEHEQFYFQIKEFLKRRTQDYNTSSYVSHYFYLESEKGLLIPRFFPIDKFIKNYQLEDIPMNVNLIKISHNITPRNKTQIESIKYIMNNKNGILQLSPGVGKTVITIFMIAEKKLKSLILVHRDSLVEQWKERFLQFTNLQTDDVSRLSSKTFKENLNSPIIISTVQTFISLLKRNRQEFLTELGKANIGILVADEIHTSIGAPLFSECSLHIPVPHVYGLSATPYRYDGNGDIIEFHLGDIFKDDSSEGTMKVDVTILLLNYEIDTKKRYRYLYWGGKFQRSRYLNMMRKSINFIDFSKSLLNKLKGTRNIIFVCERIKIIEELFDWLDFNSKGKFISSAKKDQLDYQVTFATPGKIRDGVDIPEKDALIITSPIVNIEQLSGRINRTCLGKQTPIIIDMVDIGCKRILSTIYKRIDFYKKKEWNIKYVIVHKNKVFNIDEEVAYKILKGE